MAAALVLSLAPSVQAQAVFNDRVAQPEVTEHVAPQMVNVSAQGDVQLTIPLMTLPGRGIELPITLSYSSSTPVTGSSTRYGLGWNFLSGSITREVKGGVYASTSMHGVDVFDGDANGGSTWEVGLPQWAPDAYHVALPGQGSETFMQVNAEEGGLDPCTAQYPCIPDLNGFDFATLRQTAWAIEAFPARTVVVDGQRTGIQRDGHTTQGARDLPDYYRFIVTTEDGTRYVFENPTIGTHHSSIYDSNSGVLDPMSYNYVNAWRLSAILGPTFAGDPPLPSLTEGVFDPEDSAVSRGEWPADDTPGAWIRFSYTPVETREIDRPDTGEQATRGFGDDISQEQLLFNITTPTHRVSHSVSGTRGFTLETYLSGAWQPVRTATLNVQTGAMGPVDLYAVTEQANRLDGITITGAGGEAGGTYQFEYYGSTARENQESLLVYDAEGNIPDLNAVDHLGYFVERTAGAVSTGTNANGRKPWLWNLRRVVYPTGGAEEFIYEQDRIGDPSDSSPPSFGWTESGAQTGAALNFTHTLQTYTYENAQDQLIGGARLRERRASDGIGTTHTTTYEYGPGRLSGIPPLFWKSSSVPDQGQALFRGDMGDAAVYYEWVRAVAGDASTVTTWYTTDAVDPAGQTDRPRRARYVSQEVRSGQNALLHRTILSGTEGWTWGLPYQVEERTGAGVRLSLRETEYDTQRNRGRPVIPGWPEDMWGAFAVYPYVQTVSGTGIPELRLSVTSARLLTDVTWRYNQAGTAYYGDARRTLTYDERTGLVRTERVGDREYARLTTTTYAWELAAEGAPYQHLLDRNRLTAPAMVVTSEAGVAATPLTAAVTTYASWVQGSNPAVPMLDGEEPEPDDQNPDPVPRCSLQPERCITLQHRSYAYRGTETALSVTDGDDFGAWLRGETPSEDWVLQQTASAFNADGSPLTVTDAAGLVATLTYGENPSGGGTEESLLPSTIFRRSRLTQISATGSGTTLTQRYEYDPLTGLVSRVVDPNGQSASFLYDALGRLTERQNASGQRTETYNYRYLLGTNSPNRIRTITYGAPSPNQTTFVYADGWGRVVQTQTQENGEDYLATGTRYDLHGRPEETIPTTRVASGGSYTPWSTIRSSAETVYGTTQPTTLTAYEAAPTGRPLSVSHPAPTGSARPQVTHVYDIAAWDEDTGSSSSFAMAPSGPDDPTTNLVEGDFGTPETRQRMRVTTTDEIGNVRYDFLDAFGRTLLERRFLETSAGTQGLDSLDTRTQYDGLGRVIRTVSPEGRLTDYRYNTLSQLVAETTPDLDGDGDEDPTNETITGATPDRQMAYDDAGRLRMVIDPNQRAAGRLLYSRYDAFGRLLEEGTTTGTAATLADRTLLNSPTWPTTNRTEVSAYQYDTATPSLPRPSGFTIGHPQGRLTQVSFEGRAGVSGPNSGYRQFSYDANGRVQELHVSLAGTGVESLIDPPPLSVRVAYDRDRAGRAYGTRFQAGVESDQLFQRTWFDAVGRMTQTVGDTTGMPSTPTATDAFPIARMYYDAAGRLVQTWQIGTVETTSTYDVRSRLTGIAARTWNFSSDTATPLFGAAYTFAPNGLVTSATFERPPATTSQAALYRYAYTYDSVHRLTAADYQACTGTLNAATCPSTVRRYDVDEVAYDGDGNITRKLWRQPGATLDYQYDYDGTSNRLDVVTNGGATVSDLSYDPNGNVTSVTGSLYAHSSVMARTNQPAWTTVGSATRRFLYDDTGWRVFEGGTDGGYTIRGAEGEELAIYTPSQVLQHHVLGPWGRRESNGTTVAYVRDMLDTPRAVTDASGTVRAMRDYYPFGLEMPGRVYVQGMPTREGFTGHELDQESGMNYAGARYYMPALGRWASRDPLATIYPGDSPYNYVLNNPLSFADPEGRCPEDGSAGPNRFGPGNCLGEVEVFADRYNRTSLRNSIIEGFIATAPLSGTVSQLDSPAPGPADAIALIIQVIGTGVIAHDIYTRLPPPPNVVLPPPGFLESATFPERGEELDQRLGLPPGTFHREVKPRIIRDHPREVARTGARNPDIGYDDGGNIVFRNPQNKRRQSGTNTPLGSYGN